MTNVIKNSQTDYFDYKADLEFEKQFNLMYPYLRIFIRKVSMHHKEPMVSNPRLLISDNITIKELCDKLMLRFGREAVIQRYTINTWLIIKQSKHWTLKNQNEEARKLSCLNPDF